MDIVEKLNILSAKQAEVFEAIRDTGAKDEALPHLVNLARNINWFAEELELRDKRESALESECDAEEDETPKPADTQAPVPAAEPSMTFAEVKAKMVQFQTAHGLDVAALMQSMGYQKLSAIPAERYDELLEKAQQIVDGEG